MAELLTATPIAVRPEWFLDVEVRDAQRVVLDELATRFDDITHEAREDLIRDIGLRNLDSEQRTVCRIESSLPKLLRVHFSKTLVALNGQSLATRCENRIEQFRRTGDRDWLALWVRRGFLRRLLAFATADARFEVDLCALLERAQR